jgi:hypothetical protein
MFVQVACIVEHVSNINNVQFFKLLFVISSLAFIR